MNKPFWLERQRLAMHTKTAGSKRDSSRRTWPLRLIAGMIGAGLAVAYSHSALADRNALWTIVHDKCVPNQESRQDPAPCEAVDLDGGERQGYAILKDRNGATQFLLIPTRRISGVESSEALAADIPNYWQAAWQARRFVEARAKRPLAWDMIGLAINSAASRSQDQLHIHIDCVHPDVRSTLMQHSAEIGPNWADLSFDLRGKLYSARRLGAAELAAQDPFKLLADNLPDATRDMARETLAVVGVLFADEQKGFVLLADRADPAQGTLAHSEDLLDHSCAVAAPE
jgi:CDP-diacylglycerol pyrophosphatase